MPKQKHTLDYIEPGDYVTLNLCDGWYKVTDVGGDYVDLVDSFGTPTDASAEDIDEVRLASEMEYAF